MAQTQLLADAQALLPQLSGLRRAIHSEPELGLFTPKTMAKVRAVLSGLTLEWRQGPSTAGEIAILKGGQPGRRVLLRGDMDALSLHEETGLAFAPQTAGTMHACGHDAHAAMLAGAAKLLCARQDALHGEVLFMYQPGEEGHHGARFMLEDDLLDPLPDAAFALHIMPNGPHGIFSGRAGPLLASSDKLTILVQGAGGHASMPHNAIDPLPIACEIICALQTMVTRQFSVFDPVVVTAAEIKCGTTDNVIAPNARLHGTIRKLSTRSRKTVQERIAILANHIARAHGASADVSFAEGFPVTNCDARAVAAGEAAVSSLFGQDDWQYLDAPIMGAEDFSYVLQKVPGAMFFLGAAAAGTDWRSCCGLHSNHMVLDESVMTMGEAVFAEVASRFLEQGYTA